MNRIFTYLKLVFLLSIFPSYFHAQTITHPASGSSSSTVTCGTTYTYYDPGGTGNYSNNQLGTLTLNPSTAGQYVSINFGAGAFNVETHATCGYDWIRIYDGPTTGSPLIGTYCNSNVPGVITSSSGSLTIVFDSDGSTVASGWAASVTCTSTQGTPIPITHPASGTSSTYIGCGATYTYYDPGGTGNYGNNQLGTYTIYPNTAGQMVQINFGAGAFSVEPNGGGCYDWIRIYDGPTTGSPLLGTYCNSNVPGVITATSGPLTIVFDSDAGTTASGWAANVTCYTACATVAGTSSASVTSGCGATNTTLSLAGEGAGSIQWQTSTDGGATWSNIAGATTDPYVHTTSATRLYRAAVTNGCTSYSTTSSYTASCPDIVHPASGFASTTIQCGGSYIYRDPGNTGNYSNNQNGLITICPSTAGQFVNVNFTAFTVENGYDFVYVFDGGDASAPILGIYTSSSLSGNVKATTSNSSGCLSFRFVSDGATTASGWTATVTCNATGSATVPTSNSEDCQGAVPICSDGTFHGGTNNYGFDELPDRWNSCLGNAGTRGEYESTWAVFSPATSGTIAFSITPTSACDYDWAIWGPYTSLECPAFTNDVPVRCSSTSLANTGGGGTTGLIAPAADVIEQNGEYGGGSNENGKLAPLNVLAGEIYVMMLDNWSANVTPFVLDWTLTNGATLDCTPPLPVTMSSFVNTCENGKTLLKWTTETETNNDYFAIEKSDEKFEFYEIGRVFGKGNSNVTNTYEFTDPSYNDRTSYYRIKQVDYNGEFKYHRIVASNCYKTEFDVNNEQLTSNSLDLNVNSFQKEYVTIYLYDVHGKLITESLQTLTQGNNKINLSNFNINSGIYMLNIVGEFHHYQTKLFRK